jgi:hypothetical protein
MTDGRSTIFVVPLGRRFLRLAAGLAVVAPWLLATACQSTPESTGPAAPPFAVGAQAKMSGLHDGIVVPVINVWNTVPPSEAVCTLQHGTLVTISDQKYNAGDSRWYFKIDDGGSCSGWVPQTSLTK